MTLKQIQAEQDKLFDEKFKTFEVEGDHSQLSEGIFVPDVETLKDYIASRDLAIENAVKAELLEKIGTTKVIMDGEEYDNVRSWPVIRSFLRTSPSR